MMTDGRTCVHKKSRLLSYDWLESRSNSSSHTSSSSIAACDDRSRVKEPNQKFHKSLSEWQFFIEFRTFLKRFQRNLVCLKSVSDVELVLLLPIIQQMNLFLKVEFELVVQTQMVWFHCNSTTPTPSDVVSHMLKQWKPKTKLSSSNHHWFVVCTPYCSALLKYVQLIWCKNVDE